MSFESIVRGGVRLLTVVALTAGLTFAADAAPRRHAALQRTAAVTGLAASHELRREGNRLCFADHYHYGSSAGQPNARAAQMAAAGSWSDFVDFEYGGEWASYARAAGKDMKCSQSGSGWSCDASARPCR